MSESAADVNFFNRNKSNSSTMSPSEPPMENTPVEAPRREPRPVYRKRARCYDMTGEKHMLVFNHEDYEESPFFKYVPSKRFGSDKDAKRLKETFEGFGYNVIVHKNFKYQQIRDEVDTLTTSDHSKTSIVVVVILTHGMSSDMVYASDRPYSLQTIMTLLQNGDKHLVGKPKLMFVQACRGGHTDPGRRVQTDSEEDLVLPTHSDCLVMYSSYPNHLSFRDTVTTLTGEVIGLGSWMIQALCDALDEDADQDIFDLILNVNERVAYRTTRSREKPEYDKKKQIPETKFTLTKKLYLV